MEFYNHCTKEQLLSRVEDILEAGVMRRTATGGRSRPYTIRDVESIVINVSSRDA